MPNQTTIIIIAAAAVVLFLFLIIVGVVAFVLIRKRKAKQQAAEQSAVTSGEFQSQPSTPELQSAPSWPEPEPQIQQQAWPEPSTARPTTAPQRAGDAGTYAGSYSYEQESSASSAPQYVEQERATAAPYSPEPVQPQQPSAYSPGPTPSQPSPFEQPTHSPFESPSAQPSFTPPPPLSSSPTPQHSPFETNVHSTPTPSQPTPSAQDLGNQVIDTGATVDLSVYKRLMEEQSKPFVAGSIVFTSGALQGQAFEIPAEGLFIGRDSGSSQVVISDPRVSKCHLWIGPRDRKVIVQDQESRNGTFINDISTPRVTQVELRDGDVVILGEANVAQFEYRAG